MFPLPRWLRSLGPLVAADLRRRYAGSALGMLWAALAPLLEVGAYALVFGWILGAARGGGLSYLVLIASGLFPWASFREALEASATVLPDSRWIRRSRVPMDLLVARTTLTASPRAVVGLLVVYAASLAAPRGAGLGDWAWPIVAVLSQTLAAFGLGLLVAPLATLFPDLRPTLVSLLTLLTFASPILYPESLARGSMRLALLCNPFTHLLRLYRSPVEPLAGREVLLSGAIVVTTALALLAAGSWARARLWWKARDLQ